MHAFTCLTASGRSIMLSKASHPTERFEVMLLIFNYYSTASAVLHKILQNYWCLKLN